MKGFLKIVVDVPSDLKQMVGDMLHEERKTWRDFIIDAMRNYLSKKGITWEGN